MFPGWTKLEAAEGKPRTSARMRSRRPASRRRRPSRPRIEMMAHNGSRHRGEEGERRAGRWCRTASTPAASPLDTEMRIAGPAAGHDRLKTNDDPTGTKVLRHDQQLRRRQDALGHGADGRGELPRLLRRRRRPTPAEAANYKRYGVARQHGTPGAARSTASTSTRSRTSRNRYGWMVEYDPYDPSSMPVKRTALGRVQARGRHLDRQQGRPGRVLLGRRRALRVPLPVRHRAAPTTRTTSRPTATCSTTARSTSRSSTRTS